MHWDKDAEELIERAPFFVRGLARRGIEEIARARGASHLSADMAHQAYAAFRGGGTDGGGDAGAQAPLAALVARLEREAELLAQNERFHTRHYRVRPCAGAVGCPRALIPVRETAEALADRIAQSGFPEFLEGDAPGRPILSHHRFQAAVAGCANACSQPQIQDFGVIGSAAVTVRSDLCNDCLECVKACHEKAISVSGSENTLTINPKLCIECGDCARACPTGARALGERRYVIVAGGKLGRHPRLATRAGKESELPAALRVFDLALAALMTNGRAGDRLASLMENGARGVFMGENESDETPIEEVADG
jgi:anaerobic sulfite reductase subunit C